MAISCINTHSIIMAMVAVESSLYVTYATTPIVRIAPEYFDH
jgi:hypothetical protein